VNISINLPEDAIKSIKAAVSDSTPTLFPDAQVSQIADMLINSHSEQLAEAVADRFTASEIAQEIDISNLDTQDIASHIDLYDISREIDLSGVASEVDLHTLAGEIDMSALADFIPEDKVAACISPSLIAAEIPVDVVADTMNMDRLAESIDYVKLASKVTPEVFESAVDHHRIADLLANKMWERAAESMHPSEIAAYISPKVLANHMVTAVIHNHDFRKVLIDALIERLIASVGNERTTV
jgi:hypothetical protein